MPGVRAGVSGTWSVWGRGALMYMYVRARLRTGWKVLQRLNLSRDGDRTLRSPDGLHFPGQYPGHSGHFPDMFPDMLPDIYWT